MTLDLTGIHNENEFYTHHYLAAILEQDLKDVFARWRRRREEQEIPEPFARLRSLAQPYFRMQNRLERTTRTAEHLEHQRTFAAPLLDALGYTFQPAPKWLDDGNESAGDRCLPVIGEVTRPSGAPELWIVEACDGLHDKLDPLALAVDPAQLSGGDAAAATAAESGDDATTDPITDPKHTAPAAALRSSATNGANGNHDATLEAILTESLFNLSEPPRWVLLLSDAQLVLIDRAKWNEKRLLRFDLDEIFGRRDESTFKAMAALLHRDSTCPADGLPLLDTLDENSHKNAHAVSEDLKYALREAIELLGNEAVCDMRERRKEKVFGRDLARDLSVECLRYMYRLLFLFYIEARPELGYAPMNSEEYRTGYSLDSLRDLELVQLTSEQERGGTFIHKSLNLLFKLVYEGFPRAANAQAQQLELGDTPRHHAFSMTPLKSHLFDPAKTPLLNRVRLRNDVLQRIIELMSLSRPAKKGGRNAKGAGTAGTKGARRRGRVSYAQLGINQLGAVYEALLSFQGFFAETDLYEVTKAGEHPDALGTAYFVSAVDLEQYSDAERVHNSDGTLRKYPKATFIYRLAGRDRQRSASYYTPEVLATCLVKYALKELLEGKSADEILELTVCEPAMGSAAFLNEAVNQLAAAYLERKQAELGETIAHKDYARELQRVKMSLADNNVYGVDLNPVAVELAEVSLWLNTISAGGFVPWFGNQLVCGNSLVGARRQVFDAAQLATGGDKKAPPEWLTATPERVPPGTPRPAQGIYHFLLPDAGMAAYNDKVVKGLAKKEIKAIDTWRKRFTLPFSPEQVAQLLRLSKAADELWQKHIEQQQHIAERTSDPLTVWGQPAPESGTAQPTTTCDKDRIYEGELLSDNVLSSSPYRRLKLVMDYWCALWFWPIEQANLLPTREEYLLDLSLILEGEVLAEEPVYGQQELPLFADTQPRMVAEALVNDYGFVDVNRLCTELPRLELVKELSERYRFLHWELQFASLFEERGGFDLVLGNPPWIKVEWQEGAVLGDFEPLYVLRKFSSKQLADLRAGTLAKHDLQSHYLSEFESADATQNFLNATQNYPLLKGTQSNLYKCFLPQAWMVGNERGVSGFLHPEGVYDDPKGGEFRVRLYPRLRYHFQFHNEFKLFLEVHNETLFSININRNLQSNRFQNLANLFSPSTVDLCFDHSGYGPVPGIKDDNNKWNITGHRDRIVEVDEQALSLFARLYDKEGTPPLQARLPALHSRQLVKVRLS